MNQARKPAHETSANSNIVVTSSGSDEKGPPKTGWWSRERAAERTFGNDRDPRRGSLVANT